MTRPEVKPFNLLRWFTVGSIASIVTIAVAITLSLIWYLRAEAIERDADLSAQFIASLVATEAYHARLPAGVDLVHLLDPRRRPPEFDAGAAELAAAEFLDHLRFLPDTLLVNVFAPDRRVLWSTNPTLAGTTVEHNPELDEAFRSTTMVALAHMETAHRRDEQKFIAEPSAVFLENYIPLLDRSGRAAVVVEIYKEPRTLLAAIQTAAQLVVALAVIGGLLAFVSLFEIVRRAARLIDAQQASLVESESLIMMGELSEAVAHGLRSPLAAIRTSAELALDNDEQSARRNARDIISEADRLSALIGSILTYAGPISGSREPVDVLRLVDATLLGFGLQIANARIRVNWVLPPEPRPIVDGHEGLYAQALSSIVSNAIEAMPEGGRLSVHHELLDQRQVLELIISDSGHGMDPDQLAKALKPFYTTKRKGFGIGLPIARRILERFGGSLQLESHKGRGTHVHLFFAVHE